MNTRIYEINDSERKKLKKSEGDVELKNPFTL